MYILRLTLVGCIKVSQNDMMELCRNTVKDIKLCRINLVFSIRFQFRENNLGTYLHYCFIVLSIIILTIVVMYQKI